MSRQVRVMVVLDRTRFVVRGATSDPAEAVGWFDDLVTKAKANNPDVSNDEVARLWVGHVTVPEAKP